MKSRNHSFDRIRRNSWTVFFSLGAFASIFWIGSGEILSLSQVSAATETNAVVISCPRDEKDGVWVSACQIGSEIQVLYHNSNTYPVKFSAKIFYIDEGGEQVRWVEHRGRPGGGQVTIFSARGRLREVTDIEMRNLVRDDQ
jgi:hypothetical protein